MIRIVAICALISLLYGCGPEGPRPQVVNYRTFETPNIVAPRPQDSGEYEQLTADDFTSGPIKIALLLPLSGPSSATGKAMLDSASLAFMRSYDPRLQLIPIDTLGNVSGAARAAREAVNIEANIIIGPLFSESINAAGPIARAANIPMVAFSNNPAVAGDGVYLLSFMPSEEVQQVVDFAARQGHKNFAALIPDGPYGDMVIESYAEAVARAGGTLTALEYYPPNAEDLFEPVKRLANYDERRRAYLQEKAALENLGGDMAEELLSQIENMEALGEPPFDAVLVPEGGELLRSLVPLLPFFEVNPAHVKFLGTGLWDDRSLVREPPLKGAWYASSAPENIDAFLDEFQQIFHYRPPRIVTLAFDAVSLATHMARYEVKSERFKRRAFLNPNGFLGIDGVFRFNRQGLTERQLSIIEIQPNGFRTIHAADDHFDK